MKIYQFLSLLLLPLFNLPELSAQQNDSAKIINLLKDDYKTMQNFDINKHISNCTSDYLLVENGEVWDMKREAMDYQSKAHRKIDRKDQFTIRLVKISGDMAYAVYGLRSEVTENNKVIVITWNESTVFRKVKGLWKIALIHSTPIDTK